MSEKYKLVKFVDAPVVINLTLVPTGVYDAGRTYLIAESCSYGGSSYIAKGTTTGNVPTDTTYWQILAQGVS